MKYIIDSIFLNSTLKCRENFSCLIGKEGNGCPCEVESMAIRTDEILPIKPQSNIGICDYMSSFDDFYICTCPTRIELYNRYLV